MAQDTLPDLKKFTVRTIKRWYKSRNSQKQTGLSVVNQKLSAFFVRAGQFLLRRDTCKGKPYKVVRVIKTMLLNSPEHQLKFYSSLKEARLRIKKIKPESKAKYIIKHRNNKEIGERLTLEEKLLLVQAMN